MYIINHAEDQVIVVDHSLLPILEKIADQFTTVRHYVVMADEPFQTTLPAFLIISA